MGRWAGRWAVGRQQTNKQELSLNAEGEWSSVTRSQLRHRAIFALDRGKETDEYRNNHENGKERA